MAYSDHLLPLGLCLLFLFCGCFAQLERQQQQLWENLREEQQHRLRAKTSCNIQQLTPLEPSIRFQSEAGYIEYWDSKHPMFECAGVEFERIVINQKGLLLPHFYNAPKLVHITQGRGILGVVFPGCAETFQSQSESSRQQGQEQGGTFVDRHQKLRRFDQGDIIALPFGAIHWVFNDGDIPIIAVSVIDVASEANQQDLTLKKFLLAGNQRSGQQIFGQGQQGQGQQGEEPFGQGREGWASSIWAGIDQRIMAEILKTDTETAGKLKGMQEPQQQQGMIIRADNLQLSIPEQGQQELQRQQQQQQQGQGGAGQQQGQGGAGRNYQAYGFQDTLCTQSLRENIAQPARADLFNPRAGRLSIANSHTLPILSLLKLSAERVFLYSDAIQSPHWNLNAHSAVYGIRGNARIQVVDDQGNSVFDGEVREGQLIIIPQNFAVMIKAGNRGFEYISFKTNDDAMATPLVGLLSVFQDLPLSVMRSAWGLNKNEAMQLKNNRQEGRLFSTYPGGTGHA